MATAEAAFIVDESRADDDDDGAGDAASSR